MYYALKNDREMIGCFFEDQLIVVLPILNK